MDMVEVKSAITDLGKAVDELRKNQERELSELKAKGFVTGESLEKHEKINAAIDAAEAAKAAAEGMKGRIDGIETAMSRGSADPGKGGTSAEVKAYREGLSRWMRKGEETGLRELEAKAMSAGVLPDGGYLVGVERSAEIEKFEIERVGMRQVARIVQTTANQFEFPRVKGGPTRAQKVSETGARSETTSPQIALATIKPGEYSSEPRVTQTMLDDATYDVEKFVMDWSTDEFVLAENEDFAAGNGVGCPRGILSYPSGTSGDQQIEQVASGNATDLTAAGLINLQSALYEVFQPGAYWAMSRASLGRIRRFTEAVNGQFLWQPGLEAGIPSTLLGKPYTIMANMPAIGAGSLSVAYGDFSRGYLIVDRIGIRTMRDPYTNPPFVKFRTTKRVGGDVIQFQAIKLQVTSA
jgi:HK97 family phage major capsid protein